jgi:hypothetical protein
MDTPQAENSDDALIVLDTERIKEIFGADLKAKNTWVERICTLLGGEGVESLAGGVLKFRGVNRSSVYQYRTGIEDLYGQKISVGPLNN